MTPKSEGNNILAKIMYDIKPMNRAIPELKKIANVLRTIRFFKKIYLNVFLEIKNLLIPLYSTFNSNESLCKGQITFTLFLSFG
jgi:hypothetical protein